MPFNFDFKSTGFHLRNFGNALAQRRAGKILQQKPIVPRQIQWNKHLSSLNKKGYK